MQALAASVRLGFAISGKEHLRRRPKLLNPRYVALQVRYTVTHPTGGNPGHADPRKF